ncbi:MAG TPA: ABC transporter substrate-binding protein [Chloroflexota bacterium]|nr:ABC transporter substrate-binding protein [Chloroflexota bacterium]
MKPTISATVPRRGGTLRVGLEANPTTLDPHFSTNAVDRQIYYAVYNNLVGLDKDLKRSLSWPRRSTSRTQSRSSSSCARASSSTTALTSMPPLSKWNFERMIDPNGGSIRRSELASIESVETPEPLTVVLKLKAPDSSILAALTDRAGMMASPAAVQKLGKDFARNPVGTGPSKFVEWMKDDHLTRPAQRELLAPGRSADRRGRVQADPGQQSAPHSAA